jgi:hypothetical protein
MHPYFMAFVLGLLKGPKSFRRERMGLLVWASAIVFLVGSSVAAEAANHYVRAGASGSANGNDWTNAYTSLPAALTRGDTYYVAAGTYPAYTFDDAESGTSIITIKKATATDHGTDLGWQATYGTGQSIFNSVLRFDRGNYIFDGQIRDESNWFNGAAYGFVVTHNNQDQNIIIGSSGRASNNVTIKYTYVDAIVGNLPSATIRRYAIDTDTYGGPLQTGLVFHRMFVNGSNNIWFIRTTNGAIIEYCASKGAAGNAGNHGEVINLYFSAENSIIRYNQITQAYKAGGGTALIAIADALGTSTPPKTEIYGNIFWDYGSTDGTIGFLGNASNGGNCTNCVVVNNTFVDGDGESTSGWGVQFPQGSGNIVRNNLFIMGGGTPVTSLALGTGGTNSHNGFGTGAGSSGTNAQTNVPTSIFLGYSGYTSFRLAAPTAAGVALSAPYDRDMFGNLRGADGNWDRGALEFTGSVITAPAPPQNVRVIK